MALRYGCDWSRRQARRYRAEVDPKATRVVVAVTDTAGSRLVIGEGFADEGARWFQADLVRVTFSNNQWNTNSFLEIGTGVVPHDTVPLP